jgi:ribosomal protein S30
MDFQLFHDRSSLKEAGKVKDISPKSQEKNKI